MSKYQGMALRLVLGFMAALALLTLTTSTVFAQCEGEWASAPAITGTSNTVDAMVVFDGSLYVGGHFDTAGGVPANNIAKWDGTTWSALGTGISGGFTFVYALAEFNGDLYAGGHFTSAGGVAAVNNIARWDGEEWFALGSGTDGDVYALSVLDIDGDSSLYVGGGFTSAGIIANTNGLAKWYNSAWSSVDGGVPGGIVDALTVFSGGSGNSALYVGGNFISVGIPATPATWIARWDGFDWSSVGGGTNGRVRAFTVFDDVLYAGGLFSSAGGVSASNIARWNGSNWSALGGGNVNDTIFSLEVFDDGPGPSLFAGGDFTTIGAMSASRIAKWRNGTWSALGSGVDVHPYALRVFNGGSGEALFAGGPFSTAGGSPVSSLAKWQQNCQRVYVNANATGANDGTSWPNAFRNLQDPLTDGTANAEIWVAAGTYKPDRGQTLGDRAATFHLVSGVELFGGFAGGETARIERDVSANTTILSGDLLGDDGPNFANNSENSIHVVTGGATDATAILDGFKVTGGNADGNFPNNVGGGMYNTVGSPTIINCTFSRNSASGGSAMFNINSSSPTLTNCTFEGNAALGDGGMYNLTSSPTLTNCTFRDNSANFSGGGMYNNNGSSPTLTNCAFSGNSANIVGGGMYNTTNSNPTLTNCTFNANWSPGGGGMYNTTSSPTLTNCAFSGNSAGGGGGMINVAGSPTIINCTFSGNTSSGSGGGIVNQANASPTVTNGIFWNNSDSGGTGESAQIQTDSGTPVVNYSIVQGGWTGAGGNNSSSNPLLFDPDGADGVVGTIDDNLRLRAGSPAMDTGSDAAVPPGTLLDLAGNPRFVGTVDMGAFEYFPDCNNNGINDDTDISSATSQDCNQPDWFWPANGIPDECDIADCGGTVECDDCNLNGVPDACDLGSNFSVDGNPQDGVPDECAVFTDGCFVPGEEQFWTCPDNWPLSGQYPDDADSAAGVAVTLPDGVVAVLNETVVIPLLRIEEGAELRITQAGAQGDLSFSAPARFEVNGTVLVSDSRVIGGGMNPQIIIGPDGMYEADGAASASAGANSASLTASTLSVVGSDCFIPPCPHGGEVTLTDSMSLTTTGDLTIDGSLANGECQLHREGQAASLSFHTPPSIRVIGTNTGINVGAAMALSGAAGFLHESLQPVTVGGDWNNQSVRPDCFEAIAGTIRMDGGAPQWFEVAATDSGGTGGSMNDFRMRTLEIGAGRQVTFEDQFDNDLQGQASCGEAQYVGTLVLEAGSTISVENCRLYYDTLVKDPTAQIVLSGCGEARAPIDPESALSDPTGLNKARAISFAPPSGAVAGGSAPSAIRVTLASLHHVDPPYTGGPSIPFTSFEGEIRWVGPPSQYVESSSNATPFQASALQCSSFYHDWGTISLLHVFGSAVVPSSSYRVQFLAETCLGIEDRCTAVSPFLTVNTARWADVETPYNPPDLGQPAFSDISALVAKFRSAAGAPIKARALLAGDDGFGNFTTIQQDLSFTHIAACVDAFRGKPYPHTIAACP